MWASLSAALVSVVALTEGQTTDAAVIAPRDLDRGDAQQEPALLVRALGSIAVIRDAVRVPIPKSKARAVLAALLIHRESLVPAEMLIDQVWGPEPPHTARHGLHVVISSLRSVFGCTTGDGSCRLMSSPAGYRLDLETDEFDVAIAEGLIRLARTQMDQGNPKAAVSAFLAAESWFRSPPYAEFLYDEFAQPEIRRLTELHASAREDRIAAQLELGEFREIIPELEGLVLEHPTREELVRLLMIALCRSGRTGDALQAYEYAAVALDREYGCRPNDATTGLADRIRRSGGTDC